MSKKKVEMKGDWTPKNIYCDCSQLDYYKANIWKITEEFSMLKWREWIFHIINWIWLNIQIFSKDSWKVFITWTKQDQEHPV